jgi:hypothetical protein
MGDGGVLEVALLVVRDAVRLAVASLFCRPCYQLALTRIVFQSNLKCV